MSNTQDNKMYIDIEGSLDDANDVIDAHAQTDKASAKDAEVIDVTPETKAKKENVAPARKRKKLLLVAAAAMATAAGAAVVSMVSTSSQTTSQLDKMLAEAPAPQQPSPSPQPPSAPTAGGQSLENVSVNLNEAAKEQVNVQVGGVSVQTSQDGVRVSMDATPKPENTPPNQVSIAPTPSQAHQAATQGARAMAATTPPAPQAAAQGAQPAPAPQAQPQAQAQTQVVKTQVPAQVAPQTQEATEKDKAILAQIETLRAELVKQKELNARLQGEVNALRTQQEKGRQTTAKPAPKENLAPRTSVLKDGIRIGSADDAVVFGIGDETPFGVLQSVDYGAQTFKTAKGLWKAQSN